MIIRLLLFMKIIGFTEAEISSGCLTRIDVLDGSQLVDALSSLLKDKRSANSADQCAIQCHMNKCDVAYFHSSSKICQFSSDSSSSASLSCPNVRAQRDRDDTQSIDTVQRFCISCQSSFSPPVVIPISVPRSPISSQKFPSFEWHRGFSNWKPSTSRRVFLPFRPMIRRPLPPFNDWLQSNLTLVTREKSNSNEPLVIVSQSLQNPLYSSRNPLQKSLYRNIKRPRPRPSFNLKWGESKTRILPYRRNLRKYFHTASHAVNIGNGEVKIRGNGLARA